MFVVFFISSNKKEGSVEGLVWYRSLPKSLTARASRFPGESFPTKGNVPQHAHKVTQQNMSKLLSRK